MDPRKNILNCSKGDETCIIKIFYPYYTECEKFRFQEGLVIPP